MGQVVAFNDLRIRASDVTGQRSAPSQVPRHDNADLIQEPRVRVGVPGVGAGHPLRPALLVLATRLPGEISLLLESHSPTKMPLWAHSRTRAAARSL